MLVLVASADMRAVAHKTAAGMTTAEAAAKRSLGGCSAAPRTGFRRVCPCRALVYENMPEFFEAMSTGLRLRHVSERFVLPDLERWVLAIGLLESGRSPSGSTCEGPGASGANLASKKCIPRRIVSGIGWAKMEKLDLLLQMDPLARESSGICRVRKP